VRFFPAVASLKRRYYDLFHRQVWKAAPPEKSVEVISPRIE
jgi:hypothetical protein